MAELILMSSEELETIVGFCHFLASFDIKIKLYSLQRLAYDTSFQLARAELMPFSCANVNSFVTTVIKEI